MKGLNVRLVAAVLLCSSTCVVRSADPPLNLPKPSITIFAHKESVDENGLQDGVKLTCGATCRKKCAAEADGGSNHCFGHFVHRDERGNKRDKATPGFFLYCKCTKTAIFRSPGKLCGPQRGQTSPKCPEKIVVIPK